jgi:hypothetical protein
MLIPISIGISRKSRKIRTNAHMATGQASQNEYLGIAHDRLFRLIPFLSRRHAVKHFLIPVRRSPFHQISTDRHHFQKRLFPAAAKVQNGRPSHPGATPDDPVHVAPHGQTCGPLFGHQPEAGPTTPAQSSRPPPNLIRREHAALCPNRDAHTVTP